MRVRRDTVSGAVREIEFFMVPNRVRNLERAEPRVRFETEEERELHRLQISKRNFTRTVNANFDHTSYYSTLTFDDGNEVHTFDDARRVLDRYVQRLRYKYPDARVVAVMGRGKNTRRIHFHMLSAGVDRDTIASKWTAGRVVRVDRLKKHNYYNGIDHGEDYTGLASYLFDHWTPEQGSHRWKYTRNLKKPERTTEPNGKRYGVRRPPAIPKGYKLVEARSMGFGHLYYKCVRVGIRS